jgi:hypothetical protein
MMLFFGFYINHAFKEGSEYYLLQIKHKIESAKLNKITFNCDFKVLENHVRPDKHFAEFYGIYNSQ